MAFKKSNGFKIVFSGGILSTIFLGLCSFVYAEIKKIPVIETKQQNIERTQIEMHRDIKDMSKKVYEMHGKMMQN